MRRHGAACCIEEDQEGNTAKKVSDVNVRAAGLMHQDALIQKPRLCIQNVNAAFASGAQLALAPRSFWRQRLLLPVTAGQEKLGSPNSMKRIYG
jgi:hypothetical protein